MKDREFIEAHDRYGEPDPPWFSWWDVFAACLLVLAVVGGSLIVCAAVIKTVLSHAR